MPEDPEINLPQPDIEPDQPVALQSEPQEEEVGDFINRHVFERDSVFFEG